MWEKNYKYQSEYIRKSTYLQANIDRTKQYMKNDISTNLTKRYGQAARYEGAGVGRVGGVAEAATVVVASGVAGVARLVAGGSELTSISQLRSREQFHGKQ